MAKDDTGVADSYVAATARVGRYVVVVTTDRDFLALGNVDYLDGRIERP